MLLSVVSAIALGAGSIVALPTLNATVPRCGTVHSPEDIVAAETHFATHGVGVKSLALTAAPAVNVVWHVIQAGTDVSEGNIPDNQVADSMQVLNNGFAGTVQFVLSNIIHTENPDWFNNVKPGSPQQTEMKEALRQGGAETLNVYTVGFSSGGPLGYALLPASYRDDPKNDGVVILYKSVPGGDQGGVLTHEVGHWVGLYHTFEGGCDGDGDFVDDTPPEAPGASGCPIGRDSCPGGGVDPIRNFMDYSESSCKTEFTPGQVNRYMSQLATYRGL